MKIEVSRQTRFILGGVMVGALVGALGAIFLFRHKRGQMAADEETQATAAEGLSPQHAASVLWHVFNVIREIADFAK